MALRRGVDSGEVMSYYGEVSLVLRGSGCISGGSIAALGRSAEGFWGSSGLWGRWPLCTTVLTGLKPRLAKSELISNCTKVCYKEPKEVDTEASSRAFPIPIRYDKIRYEYDCEDVRR